MLTDGDSRIVARSDVSLRPYLTPADLLVQGLKLGPLPTPPTALPAGSTCAISGQSITSGYRVPDLVTQATSEFLDCFRCGAAVDGWVSENAGRCFKNADPRRGNPTARSVLAFGDGTCYQPLIAQASAVEQGRACWSRLVRDVWPSQQGQQCLCIVTTDTKKRLWHRARVGALGPRTPVLLYDGKLCVNEVRLIDWPTLLGCLDLVEQVYALGFAKEVMRESLWIASKVAQAVGLVATRRLETTFVAWRRRPEFHIALLISQKPAAPEVEPTEEAKEENLIHGCASSAPDVPANQHPAQLALL